MLIWMRIWCLSGPTRRFRIRYPIRYMEIIEIRCDLAGVPEPVNTSGVVWLRIWEGKKIPIEWNEFVASHRWLNRWHMYTIGGWKLDFTTYTSVMGGFTCLTTRLSSALKSSRVERTTCTLRTDTDITKIVRPGAQDLSSYKRHENTYKTKIRRTMPTCMHFCLVFRTT